jgi:hypothetical protein
LSLNELGSSRGQFGVRSRLICSGPKLRIDLRHDGLGYGLGAIDTSLRGADGLLRSNDSEVSISRRNGYLELRSFQRGLGLCASGIGDCDASASKTEVERLPRNEPSNSGSPYTPQVV